MRLEAEANEPRRILIVLPNWVGDVTLATPALLGVRARYRAASITALLRPHLSELIQGGDWHDRELHWPASRGMRAGLDFLTFAGSLRSEAFDCALLLTHSFRSALLAWLARIPRRIGFERDGRRWLLTDPLPTLRAAGRFVPAPVSRSYAQIVNHLGCAVSDLQPRLGITPRQEDEGRALLSRYGLISGRYAVVSAGAAFGEAKCWLPERFAQVCDELSSRTGLLPVLVGAPGERALMRKIAGLATRAVVCCDDPFTTLGTLKVLVRAAALMIANDSGPRHIAIAFRVPTVTIFGPTHQAWTDTGYSGERRLQAQVECGPCQLRRCPLDHRCMKLITAEQVVQAAQALSGSQADAPGIHPEVGACV